MSLEVDQTDPSNVWDALSSHGVPKAAVCDPHPITAPYPVAGYAPLVLHVEPLNFSVIVWLPLLFAPANARPAVCVPAPPRV